MSEYERLKAQYDEMKATAEAKIKAPAEAEIASLREALAEAQREIAGLNESVAAMEERDRWPKCACSHDAPGDVCAVHSPRLASLEAALAEARAGAKAAQEIAQSNYDAYGRVSDQLQETQVELAAAESQRDRAVQAAGRLLDCIEVLAERAAEVGWLDRDQRVEGEILAARELLKEAGTP